MTRKIVATLEVRTDEKGKFCALDCPFHTFVHGLCSLFGRLVYHKSTVENIRHRCCIEVEVK